MNKTVETRIVLLTGFICLAVLSTNGQSLATAVDAPQLTWTTGGNQLWAGQTGVTHDGVDAARSGVILDSQESWIQTSVTGPGLLTFWWKASSELDFDFLEFYVNGILQSGEISGEVDWQQRVVDLNGGNQTLRWRYTKDDSVSDGQDRAWLDQVSFTPASGSVTSITNPFPANSDVFGRAVAPVGADRILVGAFRDDEGATDAGAAYLFSTNGTLLTTFTNPTPEAGDFFGWSVASVGESRVIVGAYQDDTGATNAGAAYLFSTDGTLLTTFTNPTPAADDIFGHAVAGLGNDRVIIGAYLDDVGAGNAGVAYLYNTDGALLTTFTNPTPGGFHLFGHSVAAVGTDRVLIGARVGGSGASFGGAAYLFSTNGTLLTTFTNPAPEIYDYFGHSVAAVGTDRVLIGAVEDDAGATNSGAAYLFDTNGNLITAFINPTPANDDYFGTAVTAVGSDRVLIGAYNDDTARPDSGAAYLFSTNGTLLATITKPVPNGFEAFGIAVAAVSSNLVLIGASGDLSGTIRGGAAYLFDLNVLVTNPPTLTIVTHPQHQTVGTGANVTFDVVAVGAPPLFYQWFKNTTAVTGATNSSLSISNVQIGDAASYSVTVSNTQGSVTSTQAVLSVYPTLLDATFNPGAIGSGFPFPPAVYSLAVQADNRILVGGSFTTLGGQIRNKLGRLNPDGSLDPIFNPGTDADPEAAVGALAMQPDGKILVGGSFSTLGGQSRTNIGRLNPDGTLDTTFNPGVSGGDFSSVYCLHVQADGKILVGGDFTTLGGQSRTNIGRLNADGTVDSTFNPKTDGPVYSLVVQPDGKVLVGGYFTRLGGQSRTNIGRLNATGTIDTTFSAGAGTDDASEAVVFALAMQADGKILVGGGFATLGGQPRANIGRLNSNGTADNTFNPGADSFVQAFAVQTDGRIVVGGDFTLLGGQPHSHIGRLNADGATDGTFNPGIEGDDFPTVFSVAVQGDGKILLGGSFTALDGQPRPNIARLHNTDPATQSLSYAGTTVTWLRGGTSPEIFLTTFDHSSNGVAWTSLGAGTRIAGGWQRTGATVPAGRILRARGFFAGSGGNKWFVETYLGKPVITQQPASRTNNFGTTVQFQVSGGGGEPFTHQWFKNGLALVDQGNITGSTSDTLVVNQVSNSDEGNYTAVLTSASGSATSLVATLTVIDPLITQQPGGAVRSLGGSVTFNVTAVGSPPLSYQWYRDAIAVTGATGSSLTLSNLSGADAGSYSVVVSNAGGSANSTAALLTVNAVTTDSTFNPGSSHAVFALAVQADGKILVGGAFTNLSGQPREKIARLHADGTLDINFNPGISGGNLFGSRVNGFAVQPDGKILVGGSFTALGGQSRNNLGRLNPNGTVDTNFNPGVTGFIDWETTVEALALQADGKIIVSGVFDTVAGGERNMIARISTTGALDSFNPGASYWANSEPVTCIAVQPDGKIVFGGAFVQLGGQGRTNIGRVTATGALDAPFNPNPNGPVSALAVQADGKILVGGNFTILGGQARTNIGRLNTNGTIDVTFNPGANGEVYSITLQADGRILLGGSFTALGGQSRNRIARLNSDGTMDATFNPGAGGAVRSLAVQADGKILAGGNFGSLGGVSRSALGRLNNNLAATQMLSYAGTTITWLRGGSTPEVWRTTFEHSANGSNWTSFGAGTRISGGWQRTGATLPAGSTLRASGQAVGGLQNASCWFVEGYYGKPVIITQPASRTNGGTTTATFQVAAGGSEPITYLWIKNGADLATQVNASGVTSNFLALANVLKADEGAYRVVVSNSFGSVTSLVANLTVLNPLITSQPVGAFRDAGTNVTFTVTAVGTPPLNYQWYRDGVPLSGATGSSLTLQNLARADAGRYTVVVSNLDGSNSSLPALLTVNVVTADSAFSPQAGSTVSCLALQPDGKVLLAGYFNRNGLDERIWRFTSAGALTETFANDSPGLYYPIAALGVQPDGKILVAGGFPTLGGQPHSSLGRLNADLTLDSTFNPSAGLPSGITDLPEIYAMAIQADGKILVGGYFSTLNGSSRNNIARLNTNGTLDTFNPGANDDVNTLAVQPDGKILVGGAFSTLGGQTRIGIGRLNTNGTVDTTFNPGVDRPVSTLAVQADGKILVGGYFTMLGGQPRNYIGRLNTNGTVDTAFNPGANDGVVSFAVQADGEILVGGEFTSLGGETRNRIARLNSDGTLDLIFHPRVEGSSVVIPGVYSLALQTDGKILAGGNFYRLAGQPREFFGRLNNTDPATDTLTYANSTITWLRGGTAPEVWRTTFERSTNGLNWTSLGAGTRIPGGWQLTGVSLPATGTLRARGQVAGAYHNSSAWFVETMLDLTPVIRLSLVRTGSSVNLNWTGGQGPFQIQQSTDLSDPNSWQNLGAPVTTNSLTLSVGEGNLFLRVRSQ